MKDSPWIPVGLAFLFGIWGLSWGLPSKERADLFLKPEMRTPEFFQRIEKARDAAYEEMGLNPIAHYGRLSREGKSHQAASPNPLSAYSGFLLRTHHGDEQQILVMLSRLNPFKGRWYPYTFQYGGAYVYPLAIYLKALQTLRLIKLVPQTAYYYAHPDEIGKVYLAVRFVSVIALMFAIVALFYLGRRLVGSEAAFWAACFFALAPACLGNAKLAKPHMWAAAWMLSSLYFSLRAREESTLKFLAAAAVCFGLAVGTTVSQAVFVPFLLWACLPDRQACWSPSWQETLRRMGWAGALALSVFLATNFYLVGHFSDFRDELFLFRTYYPWGFSLHALWDFFFGALRASYGTLLWVTALIGMVSAIGQRQDSRLRTLALLGVGLMVLLAFQNQSQEGSGVISRLFLALLGLACLYASWWMHAVLRARWLSWICVGVLLGTALLYARHYASDQVPEDNASQAANWVRENVPPQSVIGQDQAIPHTFGFPPIDFSAYRIVQIGTPQFDTAKGKTFAILPLWADQAREHVQQTGYTRVKVFAESPLQKVGFSDPFTTANFPLEIYAR